jgi:hypothetical protein
MTPPFSPAELPFTAPGLVESELRREQGARVASARRAPEDRPSHEEPAPALARHDAAENELGTIAGVP